eukprot:maker-scaffold_63-snap-gene-0.11-mRNA-1 protein AED:0.00 eAED:0.00 QI:65/1/1/1/0/0.5/2/213/291
MEKRNEDFVVEANLGQDPDHTGNGILFEVKALRICPIRSVTIKGFEIHGFFPTLLVSVANTTISSYRNATWRPVYTFIPTEAQIRNSQIEPVTITLPEDSKINIQAGQSKLIYLYTNRGALTYCDERYHPSFQNEFISVGSGYGNMLYQQPTGAIDLEPINMRPLREFQGKIYCSVEFYNPSPRLKISERRMFGNKFNRAVSELLVILTLGGLPTHFVYRVLMFIPYFWFEADGFKVEVERINSRTRIALDHAPFGWGSTLVDYRRIQAETSGGTTMSLREFRGLIGRFRR